MAMYRFSAKIISRSAGRSAVFAAAYRAGERLHDERLGRTISFERKQGISHKEILAPYGSPTWVFDRQALWNQVEKTENLADSQLSREIQVALPAELSPEGQLTLTRAFIQEQFVSRGMVADFAIHREHDDNPHVHVMLTMRSLGPDGFGNKNAYWNEKPLFYSWRESWAEHVNLALAREGFSQRIDHRSYADQGIELEPQPKLYRRAQDAHLDGRDHVLDRLSEYQRTVRRNGNRIISRPEIALEVLEKQQPTFTKQDIQRLVHRQTADAAQFERAMNSVMSSLQLVQLNCDDGELRYTTKSAALQERALVAEGRKLHARHRHVVRHELVEQAIAFAPVQLNSEQTAAVRQITQGGDLAIVEGYAGTGKSTLLDVARVAWEAQGCRVVGGALAGKAAEGLQESAHIPSRTLASWQLSWRLGRDRLKSGDVLVLDEAGMIGTRQLAEIAKHVRSAGAKLVLVGDTKQLQAIDPGAPMRLFAEQYGAVHLRDIQRQRSHAWQRDASLQLANFNTSAALQSYDAQGRVHALGDADAARRALIEAWQRDRLAEPNATSLLMAFRRKDVRQLNEAARAVRRAAGELGEDQTFATQDGQRQFAQGDRVYFLKNDGKLEVTNGSLGTIHAIVGSNLIVELDNRKQVVVDTRVYKAIDHGYAGTIHKGQGVTVDRGYVLASKYMEASATYVGMTRHKKDAQLFYSEQEFSTRDRLFRSLSRVKRVRMIHEQSGPELSTTTVAQEARQLERTSRLHEAFFAMAPEARAEKLASLVRTASEPSTNPEECLSALPEIQKAAADRARAGARVVQAQRAAEEFLGAHPIKVQLQTVDYRAHLTVVEQAGRVLLAAEIALGRLRQSPSLLARAERIAIARNRDRQRARAAWQKLSELERQARREAQLGRYIAAANTLNASTKFRALTNEDHGASFTVVAHRTVGGEPVTVLRDAQGALVVADVPDALKQQARPQPGAQVLLRAQGQLVETETTLSPSRGRDL